MLIFSFVVLIFWKIHRNPQIWQHWSQNVATLLVGRFFKCLHSISRVKKRSGANFEPCSPNSLRDILETYKSGKTVGQNLATLIENTSKLPIPLIYIWKGLPLTWRHQVNPRPILATRAEKPTFWNVHFSEIWKLRSLPFPVKDFWIHRQIEEAILVIFFFLLECLRWT